MSRLLGAVCLGVAATAAVATVAIVREVDAPAHRSPTTRSESADAGRIIVKFKAKASTLSEASSSTKSGPQAASVLGSRLGLSLTDGRVLGTRTQVLKATGIGSGALAAAVAQDADVEWAEVDHRRYVQTAPSDPLYTAATSPAVGQWYLRAPTSSTPSAINIEPAWAITTNASSSTAASGSAIVIADVDTGITTHPDLTGSVSPSSADSKVFPATFSGTTSATAYGYDFVGYTSTSSEAILTANDGGGADPDPSDPGDWITAAEDAGTVDNGDFKGCGQSDSSWHGTQTAGILGAATNNGVGMAGTGYNTMIVPVRALGKCGGYDSDIIAAAQWAAGISTDTSLPTNTHPARVINMSLGGTGSCGSAYQEALTQLRNARVFVVAAAGNDEGLPVDAPGNCQPAASDADQTPIVIAVAGLRNIGDKVGYSDIGPEVTIAAPAGNCINTATGSECLYPILTTANTGTTTPVSGGSTYTTGGTNASLGTSFATPMVAGTVALMLAASPDLTNAQVISLLKNTARAFPTTGGTAGTGQCTAPSSSVTQDECYCTTATCGAGMLDAGAAVTAALALATPAATITSDATSVTVGNTLTLSGATSTGSAGGSVASYAWTITSGSSLATLSASSGSSVVLTAVGTGSVTVALTVTDATGATASTSTTVNVAAATSSTGSTGSSGGGGGGAANPAWLAALIAAGLLLTPRRRAGRRD